MKRQLFSLVGVIALIVAMFACAGNQPPAGLTPAAQKAFTATQYINDLNALSQTVIALNVTSGPTHVSDDVVQVVKPATLIAAAGLNAWGSGQSTLSLAKAMIDALKLPPDVLAVVDAAMDTAIAKHGAGASALSVVIDIFNAANVQLQATAAVNTVLKAALNVVAADVALLVPQS